MKLAESRLTRQGQISVPVEVRRRLGLQPGSVLEWEADGETIVVRRAGQFTSQAVHEVLFPVAPKRRSLADLKKGIERHVRAKHARR
jgi:AbrB family looped-hinge helix DNA binding protein